MPCHMANNTLYTIDRWQSTIQNEIRNVGPQMEKERVRSLKVTKALESKLHQGLRITTDTRQGTRCSLAVEHLL